MLLSTAMRQSGTRGPTSLPHWPLPYLQNPHPISVSTTSTVLRHLHSDRAFMGLATFEPDPIQLNTKAQCRIEKGKSIKSFCLKYMFRKQFSKLS